MPETPHADRLAAMSDAELIEDAARQSWTCELGHPIRGNGTHLRTENLADHAISGDLEHRLAELERKVNHAELPESVVQWFAELAKHGAVTGSYSIPCGVPYGPVLQYSIYPDGRLWLQVCDFNLASIWRLMLTPPGKVPAHG
jgi:hypothetical protein